MIIGFMHEGWLLTLQNYMRADCRLLYVYKRMPSLSFATKSVEALLRLSRRGGGWGGGGGGG